MDSKTHKPVRKPAPPWRKKRSASSSKRGSVRLTAEEKERARRRAQRAGRRYPNLVDNMWVTQQRRKSVPRTVTPARRIAATGQALLQRNQRLHDKA